LLPFQAKLNQAGKSVNYLEKYFPTRTIWRFWDLRPRAGSDHDARTQASGLAQAMETGA
jgi:hypothetical protein